MHLPCQPPVSSTSVNTNTHTAQKTPRAPMNYPPTRAPGRPVLAEGSWTRQTRVQIPALRPLTRHMVGGGRSRPLPCTAMWAHAKGPWG